MKATLLIALLGLCIQTTFAQNLKIDTKNSILNWTGHAEVGSYAPAGTLNFKSGNITVNNEQIGSAILTVDMGSMQTGNGTLLEHLKSDDFFDVTKYTTSTISITRIENGRAYGLLTLKGKTLPFNCPVSISNETDKIMISGNTVIDRTSYGIIYNSGSFFSGLGDKAIKNTFDVAFKIVVAK